MKMLAIGPSTVKGGGRGVFTKCAIKAGEIIETAPVIILGYKDTKILTKTKLTNYIFDWSDKTANKSALALGYISLYNHSYNSNCEYEMDFETEMMQIKAICDIDAGAELFVNYNGTYNDEKPVWFDPRYVNPKKKRALNKK